MDAVAETKQEECISWDTYEIAKSHAEYLIEEGTYTDFDEAFKDACNDSFLIEDQWEYICDWLGEWMKEINPSGIDWFATVENFGWRHLNGKTAFEAKDGEGFLDKVLPKTDCTFKIYKREGHLEINNAHHDAPCGGEMYYIYPGKTCEACGKVFPLDKFG